jgi:hypothetical protein
MTESISPKPLAIERIVLWIGIFLLIIPSVLLALNIQFTEHFFGSRDVLSQSPIGEVIRLQRSVRKHGEAETAFNTAHVGDPVFVGDTILTGKNSTTRITLSGGEIVELGPESMIRIEPIRSFGIGGVKKKIKITVETGTVKAASKANAAPMVVESSAGKVLAEIAAPIVAPIATPVPMAAATPQGTLTASAPLATPIPVATVNPVVPPEPEPIFFVTTQAPEERAVPVQKVIPVETPAPPAPKITVATMPATPTAATPLPTATPLPVASPAVIVSNGNSAREIMAREVAIIEKEEALKKVSPGVAQKPVEIAVEKPLLSKVNLVMKVAEKIKILTSSAKKIVEDELAITTQDLKLQWKDAGVSIILPYTITTFHHGKKSVYTSQTPSLSLPIPVEEEGSIEWWVEAPLKDGGTMQSDKQKVTWQIPLPILASPENHQLVPPLYLKGASRSLLLTWKEMPICIGYELQVSQSPSFVKPIYSASIKSHFQPFPVPKAGEYFWRVGCIYKDAFKLYSAPQDFRLENLGNGNEN